MADCHACGRHTLNYIACDRWDCPFLRLKVAQENLPEVDREESEPDHDAVNGLPDAELYDPEDDTIGGEWDEMADYPLEDEGGEDEEE